MAFRPTALSAADIGLPNRPSLGAYKRIFVLPAEALEIGTFQVTAASTGVWTPVSGVILPAAGADLVAMVSNVDGMNGGASDVVLTIAGKDGTDQDISGVATFDVPSYAQITAKYWPISAAADAVVTGGTKFKGGVDSTAAVTGVTVACDADAYLCKITLFAMPAGTFTEIPGVRPFNFSSKGTVPKAIQDRLNGSRWTAFDVSKRGDFSFETLQFQLGNDASRFESRRLIMRIDEEKDDRVVTARTYLLGATYTLERRSPNGGDEATYNATGVYENALMFIPAAAS